MEITKLYKQINRENSFEKLSFEELHSLLEEEINCLVLSTELKKTIMFLISNYMLDEYNSLKEELEMLKANNNASLYENDGESK